MNYILEINAFCKWLSGHPLRSNGQALWHRLMAYCNSFGWRENFTLTNGRLCEDIGISRQELDRVRKTLCKAGLIAYRKGRGNQCGAYRMISLVTQPETQTAAQTDTQTGHKQLHNRSTLNKQNKNKQNNHNEGDFKSKTNKNGKTETPPSYDLSRMEQLGILTDDDLQESQKYAHLEL